MNILLCFHKIITTNHFKLNKATVFRRKHKVIFLVRILLLFIFLKIFILFSLNHIYCYII